MISWIRRWSAALVCGIYWGVGSFVFMVAAVLARPLSEERTRRWGRRLLQGAFGGFVGVLRLFRIADCEMVGFEQLEGLEGGLIIAPNHPAIWDAVFILARLSGLTCILKAALLRNPLVAGGARLSKFIPNDPPADMVKRCVTALVSGDRLLLFPEGTRTRKQENVINEFRGGVAILAKHAKVPVYPVFVETNDDFGAKGMPVWYPPEKTVQIRMTLGKPLTCGDKESAHDFLDRLRAEYIAALSGASSPE